MAGHVFEAAGAEADDRRAVGEFLRLLLRGVEDPLLRVRRVRGEAPFHLHRVFAERAEEVLHILLEFPDHPVLVHRDRLVVEDLEVLDPVEAVLEQRLQAPLLADEFRGSPGEDPVGAHRPPVRLALAVRVGEADLLQVEVRVAQLLLHLHRHAALRPRPPHETAPAVEGFQVGAVRVTGLQRRLDLAAQVLQVRPVVAGALPVEQPQRMVQGRQLLLRRRPAAETAQPVVPTQVEGLLAVPQDAVPNFEPGDLVQVVHVALRGAPGDIELALDPVVGDSVFPGGEEEVQQADDPIHRRPGVEGPGAPARRFPPRAGLLLRHGSFPQGSARERGSAAALARFEPGNSRACSSSTNRSVIPAM